MIHVRRHKRVTASGKTVTVRAHEREGDDDIREVPEWSRPARVSDFARPAAASEPEPDAGDWWDDGAAEPDAPEFNSPAAREELRDARRELERVSKGLREETEEYHAANRRVLEAEKHVSWWRR